MGWCIRSLSWCAGSELIRPQCELSRWTRPWLESLQNCTSSLHDCVSRLHYFVSCLHDCVSCLHYFVSCLHDCDSCYLIVTLYDTIVSRVTRLCILTTRLWLVLHDCVSWLNGWVSCYTIVSLVYTIVSFDWTVADPVACTLHAGSPWLGWCGPRTCTLDAGWPCVSSCEPVESLPLSATINWSSYDRDDSRAGFTTHALTRICHL